MRKLAQTMMPVGHLGLDWNGKVSLAPIGRAKDIEWEIKSKKDPRWNKSGRTQGFLLVRVHAANKWIKKCRKEYGRPPADLTYQANAL